MMKLLEYCCTAALDGKLVLQTLLTDLSKAFGSLLYYLLIQTRGLTSVDYKFSLAPGDNQLKLGVSWLSGTLCAKASHGVQF